MLLKVTDLTTVCFLHILLTIFMGIDNVQRKNGKPFNVNAI